MKFFKSFLIVLVLLCLVLCTFACDSPSTDDTIKDVAPVTVTAEAIMSNFITFEYVETEGSLSASKNLSEEYGTLTSSGTTNLLVFRKETKDYMNKVTVTFTVYSICEKKAVATFTHQYEDEDYNRSDDFGNSVFPASQMYVTVSSIANNSIDYITVTKITNTRIDDELIEKNELNDSYSHSYSFEYYDAQGTHITTTSVANTGRLIDYNNDFAKVSFGKTFAVMDMVENKLVKTYDGDVTGEYLFYSYSNDRYNYSLNSLYGGVDGGYPIGGNGKIEVYTKSGKLVCEYIYSDYAMNAVAHVLANGDIMIQYLFVTDKISCDFVIDGNNYDLQTLLLDVETGKTTEVEFNYFIGTLYDTDELAAQSLRNGISITFNETNVRNVASAVKIENGSVNSGATDLIFFDDLLNVNYVLDKTIPDQDVDGQFVPLFGGYFLVELVNETNAMAIVKDGQVVTYVPESATVTEYAIITENGIYNLSMNLLLDLSESDYVYPDGYYPTQPDASEYTFRNCIGKYAIYYYDDFEIQIAENEYEYKDYVMIVDTVDGSYTCYENSTVSGAGNTYLAIYNSDSEIYQVYGMVDGMSLLIESKVSPYIIEDPTGDAFIANISFGSTTQTYLFEILTPEY